MGSISSIVQKERNRTVHKGYNALESKFNMQRNKINHLEDLVIRYESYTIESLDKIVSTIGAMHNKTTNIGKVITWKLNELVYYHLSMHGIIKFLLKHYYVCIPLLNNIF